MKISMIPALFLVILACGNSAPSGADPEVISTETEVPMLHVTAEIGVELGDSNFVFGVIQDVDFTQDGNIAILDTQKKKVRLFSPSGSFLGEFGGEGEAPGEFLNPRGIACLRDGRIAVTDPFSREVEIFSSDLLHSETVSNFTTRAPFVISAAGNGFAGEQGGFNRDAGTVTTSVALWETDTDSAFIFFELEDDFSPENMIDRIMQPSAGLMADLENLYYSPPVSQDYAVSVYPMDGSEPFYLTFPDYEPVTKSEEDIQDDILAYEYRMQAMASSGRGSRLAGANYEPPPHYYATGSIGLDSQGNVWVQRGWEPNPSFDLFSAGETVPFETVIVDPELDLSGFTFTITPNGIAAFDSNPDDFPKVLVLSF